MSDSPPIVQPVDLIAPWLADLKPYAVEDVSGLIKLDAMENPYTFPSELKHSWLERLSTVEINRYPDPHASELKAALHRQLELPPQASIVVGNGSDELIHMLCLAFNRPGAKVLTPAPSFAVYPLAARAVNMRYVGVPLEAESFELRPEIFIEAIKEQQPSLVFIASPNNPTGNRFRNEDIRAIAEHTNGLVVLDEAYWRFAQSNSIKALFDLENIVFMHTLSKIGLAGVRLGALIGQRKWLDPLERVRMPYNVGSLTQATACFALENDRYFQVQVDEICLARTELFADLVAIPGVKAWPSETNFILFRVEKGGPKVHRALLDAGVAVKNLHGAHEYLANCLRVSVGTPEENGIFIEKLAQCCGQ